MTDLIILLINLGFRNSKLLAEVEKRKQVGGIIIIEIYSVIIILNFLDDVFRRAGISSAVPTYKYDPTKVKQNNPPQIRKQPGASS